MRGRRSTRVSRLDAELNARAQQEQQELPGLGSPALVQSKVAYVKSQRQTRKHHCHWGCKPHWFRLPPDLRNRIWNAYRPGQEKDMSPSESYLQVANEVQAWIRRFGGPV